MHTQISSNAPENIVGKILQKQPNNQIILNLWHDNIDLSVNNNNNNKKHETTRIQVNIGNLPDRSLIFCKTSEF